MSAERRGNPEVALVTGSAGGLGRACLAALAARGAHVVAADLDGAAAEEAATELRAEGGSASSVGLDVRDPDAVDRAVANIVAERGSVDVLVNLAGALRNQLLAKIAEEDFELVLATHLKGTLHTMRAAIPTMRARGRGRIVNMSSVAARGSIAGSAYGAAKGGIEGLTRSGAMEVARDGITINCVAPGLVNAGMFLSVDRSYQEEVTERIPMRRLGEAEEVASCVAFLTSSECSYVTGQTLVVCGGLSLGF